MNKNQQWQMKAQKNTKRENISFLDNRNVWQKVFKTS